MSIYDNNKELLSTLGVEGNYSTDFEVRKAILNALGGDASTCNSIYEVDLQILKIYQEGGGGSAQKPVFKIKNGNVFRTNETEIPFDIDSSEVTDFRNMFDGCTNLAEVPLLDTSNGTNFSYMFYNCNNITTIPQLDTSNGTDFNNMFAYCNNLAEVPLLDTSNGTEFNHMFANCNNLAEVPQLDTSKGISFGNMFYNCTNLITILGIDISKGTTFNFTFSNCRKLENITFVGSINGTIDFSYCISLSYDSVKNILTACSNKINTNSKTLRFKRTLTDQNGELANLIATCNSKGWTISGLTLQ